MLKKKKLGEDTTENHIPQGDLPTVYYTKKCTALKYFWGLPSLFLTRLHSYSCTNSNMYKNLVSRQTRLATASRLRVSTRGRLCKNCLTSSLIKLQNSVVSHTVSVHVGGPKNFADAGPRRGMWACLTQSLLSSQIW